MMTETNMYYKVFDLFGNEEIKFYDNKKTKENLFTNYDGFLEKFDAKKTTDDCYTPENIYNIIINYVKENYNLTEKVILRPFFPGGDYESIDYESNSVVIDNPPFSIISKIARFYTINKIPFFLFAPHLTLFSSDLDCTHIVCGADIVYENGAKVKTSFLSNMFGDYKIIGDCDLYRKLMDVEKNKKIRLPKYEYPSNVLMVSDVSYIVEKGINIKIKKDSTKHLRQLDSQKKYKKTLFGSGFLISEKAAAEKAAAEKAAAEKENIVIWELSDKEIEIINKLF